MFLNQVMREGHVKEILETQVKLEALQSELSALNKVVSDTERYNSNSTAVHKSSAAMLALETVLKTSKPFKNEISAIEQLAG